MLAARKQLVLMGIQLHVRCFSVEFYGEDHNYCRNYEKSGFDKPWCYVQDDNYLRRQCCDVPVCDQVLGLNSAAETSMFICTCKEGKVGKAGLLLLHF